MSGEAGIAAGVAGVAVAGAVIVPIIVGGALLAGTALAVRGLAYAGKGIAGAARQAHEENVRRRIDEAYTKTSRLLSETAGIRSEMRAAMANASGEACEAYARAVEGINDSFKSEPDTSKFVESYVTSKKSFSAEFQKSLSEVEKSYRASIETAANKTRAAIQKERDDTLASINAVRDDMAEREARCRAAADDAIDKTGTVIREFAENHKNNPHANDYAVSLTNALNTAIDRYNSGQYETALIDAYDTYSKCIVTVESLLAEDIKTEFLYERCMAGIAELQHNLDSTHIVDYEFADTVNGEPVTYQDLDMTMYYAGKREMFISRTEQLKNQLAVKDKSGFTAEELIDLITATDDLNIQYVKETAVAFERLYNLLERMQYADLISAAYTDMGFEEVEPDDAPPQLESLIVKMENRSSGETVKIYLNAKTDENSRISTGIDILSHSDDIDSATERKRTEQRENVCTAIMNSDYGKRRGITATQSCKGGTVGKNAF